jgi:hypothetical protein
MDVNREPDITSEDEKKEKSTMVRTCGKNVRKKKNCEESV